MTATGPTSGDQLVRLLTCHLRSVVEVLGKVNVRLHASLCIFGKVPTNSKINT